jgi:glycosyltransferase involved in cell wall biosynthesis
MDFDDFEIVVVDDGSTDETPAALEGFRAAPTHLPIVVVRNPRNLGVSGARNTGLEAARGELVAFTDSDCTVDPGWLRALAACFDAPEIAAAGGTVIDAPPRSWAEHAYVGTCRIGVGALQGRPLVGNNMCFRGELARRHRFEPALAYGCDEDELAWRLQALGYRFRFAPAAIVHHDHPLTVRGYLRMAWRQGTGSARYGYKRGFYLGRDLLLLFATLATLPLALLDLRLLALPLALFGLQLAAMTLNEIVFKGKSLGAAFVALPLVLLFNLVKAASVLRVLARIAVGREPELVRSKRLWREQLAAHGR